MMRLQLASLLFGAAALAAPAQAEPTYETLSLALTDRVVIPAYERMVDAMAGLHEATDGFCRAPDADGLATVTDAFHVAMDAWQRAQPVVLGPVTWDGRSARIQFWPDKGGTGTRQIKRALQGQDSALLADGGLDGKSVALQSLAAYERIVFGRGAAIASDQASDADRYACGLAAAIARFQAGLAAQILEDWTKPGGYRAMVATAAAGNEYYVGAEEPAAELLKSLTATLDMAIQLKLERPLGKSIDKARGKRTESWRSARSRDNILANLDTAQALYTTPGGFGDMLIAAGAEPLDQGLRTGFQEAMETARSIAPPLHTAIADETQRPRVEALLAQLKSLRLLIAGPVAEEIGLVVGFNAFDGD